MKTKILFFLAGSLFLLSCSKSSKQNSKLRIGQFLFTEAEIEITFSKKGEVLLQEKLVYPALTDYSSIKSGIYEVAIKTEDQDLIKKKIGIGSDGVYTLMLYGIPQKQQKINQKTTNTRLHEMVEGEEASSPNANLPQLKVLNDKFECGKNEAKVRWVHLAPGVEEITGKIKTEKQGTTQTLSALTYPKISKTKAVSTNTKNIKWNLKGNKVEVANTQLQTQPEKLYTFFVLGKQGAYANRLQIITAETPKTQF